MEERLPPSTAANKNNPPPVSSNERDRERSLQLVPSLSHHHSHQSLETYVIQIPKDQIYRVPPPENAQIVERYRNPEGKTRSPRSRCICCTILFIAVVGLFAGIIYGVYSLTLNPKTPNFGIKHVVPRQTNSSSHNSSLSFDILLEVTNPNKVNNVGIKEGQVSLLFKGHEIGRGKFPVLEQGGKEVDEADLAITGTTKGKVPEEIEESMKGSSDKSKTKKKKDVSLSLKMEVSVKLKTWMSTKSKDLTVTCDFVMSSLSKDADIKSQKCEKADG
ncbi:hypothetical protein Ancab_026342 [Ancistrocladus abbreviatus]